MQESNEKKKILSIDYGDFSIGLAIFDVDIDFIYPYKTIFRDKSNILRKSIREIVEIIRSEGITDVVIGLPLNVDGSSGDRVLKVQNFAHMLENKIIVASDARLHFQDERFSTIEAEEILKERKVKKSEWKKVVDQIAAEIILQDYRNIIKGNL